VDDVGNDFGQDSTESGWASGFDPSVLSSICSFFVEIWRQQRGGARQVTERGKEGRRSDLITLLTSRRRRRGREKRRRKRKDRGERRERAETEEKERGKRG